MSRKPITKAQALASFRREVLPFIRRKQNGRADIPACREGWNNYTDALYRDGLISPRQYDRWTNPF